MRPETAGSTRAPVLRTQMRAQAKIQAYSDNDRLKANQLILNTEQKENVTIEYLFDQYLDSNTKLNSDKHIENKYINLETFDQQQKQQQQNLYSSENIQMKNSSNKQFNKVKSCQKVGLMEQNDIEQNYDGGDNYDNIDNFEYNKNVLGLHDFNDNFFYQQQGIKQRIPKKNQHKENINKKIQEIQKNYMNATGNSRRITTKPHTSSSSSSSRPQTAGMRNQQQKKSHYLQNVNQNNLINAKYQSNNYNNNNISKNSQSNNKQNTITNNTNNNFTQNLDKSITSTTVSPRNSDQQLKNEVEEIIDKIQARKNLNPELIQQQKQLKQNQNQNTNLQQSPNSQKMFYNPQQFNQKKNINKLSNRPSTAFKRPPNIQNSNKIQPNKLIDQDENLEKLVDGLLIKATGAKPQNNNNKIDQDQHNNNNYENINNQEDMDDEIKNSFNNNIVVANRTTGKSSSPNMNKRLSSSGRNRFYTNNNNNYNINQNNNQVLNSDNKDKRIRHKFERKPPVPRFSQTHNNNNINQNPQQQQPKTSTNSQKILQQFCLNQRPTTAGQRRTSNNKLGFIDTLLGETFYKHNINMQQSTGKHNQSSQQQQQQQQNQNSLQQQKENLLDRYSFGKVIGKGSYAIVRIATDTHTQKSVAVKTYDKFKLIDNQKRTNLRREIQILKALDHQNIVRLYNTIDTRTNINLVMEYIGSLQLRQYIRDSPEKKLKENEAQIIFSQLVGAVAYIHSQDIVHRDIKLENVIIKPQNLDLRLIDFGFAVKNNKKLTIFCGTPSYMAPEIVKKQEYYGKPADVWALGILLYAMLYGKFPFKGKDDYDLYKKIGRCEFKIPNGPSLAAQKLLQKILKASPQDRPSCREILREEWMQ